MKPFTFLSHQNVALLFVGLSLKIQLKYTIGKHFITAQKWGLQLSDCPE